MLTLLQRYGLAILFILISFTTNAQVKIGDNPNSINSNSLLELESTTKGLLLPRLTAEQIAAMTNVPKGMLIFNLTDSALFLRRDTGWAILSLAEGEDAATNKWGTSGSNIYSKNTGNVGIGTTTPTAKLTVKKDGIGISQENLGGTVKVGFAVTSTSAFVQTHTNHPLRFATNNGSTSMIVSTTGNVGIGTTSPVHKLDVNGDINATSSIVSGGNISYTGNLDMGLQYLSTEFSVAGNNSHLQTKPCPAGTKIIGGGGGHAIFNNAADDIKVNFSGPDSSINSWRLIVDNTSGDSRGCIIWVICAKVQ